MSDAMPDLMSAALFERNERVLTAHRKTDHPPFAGQWLLPMTIVGPLEGAEDALRRHAREQFGAELGAERFVDTVYLEDPEDRHRYVANIFRAPIEGPLRFNAEGDYDDARWAAAAELGDLWMPPALREPLVRIMTEAVEPPDADWTATANTPDGQGIPLGERGRSDPDLPTPDNRAAWDEISARYQQDIFGERFPDRLMWSWSLSEDDLHLLDDVRGKRMLVLGCGGGQDVVALERLGAVALGIDQSARQIEYALAYAARHDARNSSFVEGTVEDLSRFDDEEFDGAVSAHMLNYVERIEDTLRETARVLKPGAFLALSVRHPFGAQLTGATKLQLQRPYWDPQQDWTWNFETGEPVRFRSWFWTVEDWFRMLDDAGFTIERVLEPQEEDANRDSDIRFDFVPYSLFIKARKR